MPKEDWPVPLDREALGFLGRGMNQRWPIPEKDRPWLYEVCKQTVDELGVKSMQGARAAELIVKMDVENLKDEQFRDHSARLDRGKPTDIVGDAMALQAEIDQAINQLDEATGINSAGGGVSLHANEDGPVDSGSVPD